MAKLRVIALSGEEVREITMTDLGEETPISELLQRLVKKKNMENSTGRCSFRLAFCF